MGMRMINVTLLYPRLSTGSRRESVISWLVFGLMMRILIGGILLFPSSSSPPFSGFGFGFDFGFGAACDIV